MIRFDTVFKRRLLIDKNPLLWYILPMRCKICQREFIPSKYRPNQKVCSRLECQKKRQIQNEKNWRLRNPGYFKYLDQESAWKDKRKRYNKLWKTTHKAELKEYEQAHSQQRKEYMREYMRNYREAKPIPNQ